MPGSSTFSYAISAPILNLYHSMVTNFPGNLKAFSSLLPPT